MSLADKLRAMRDEPADRDLLEYFGIVPGDPFQITAKSLTVGDETLSLEEARRAMNGEPPPRRVVIGDL